MPKFQVELTRETNNDHGSVTIKAKDAQEARRIAEDIARYGSPNVEWTDGDEVHRYVKEIIPLEEAKINRSERARTGIDSLNPDAFLNRTEDEPLLKHYLMLHDGLSDMIEEGRLTEDKIPDDYRWLVRMLVNAMAIADGEENS